MILYLWIHFNLSDDKNRILRDIFLCSFLYPVVVMKVEICRWLKNYTKIRTNRKFAQESRHLLLIKTNCILTLQLNKFCWLNGSTLWIDLARFWWKMNKMQCYSSGTTPCKGNLKKKSYHYFVAVVSFGDLVSVNLENIRFWF